MFYTAVFNFFETRSWAHFTNDVSVVIQIRWELHRDVITLLGIISQQIFAHATAADLSWHVKNNSDHLVRAKMRAI